MFSSHLCCLLLILQLADPESARNGVDNNRTFSSVQFSMLLYIRQSSSLAAGYSVAGWNHSIGMSEIANMRGYLLCHRQAVVYLGEESDCSVFRFQSVPKNILC